MQVIKAELCCDNWLDFAMVTVGNSVVCTEMYRDSVFALLRKANFKLASHFCPYKFDPNMDMLKADLRPTVQTVSNNTKRSPTSFSVFEICKLPQVYLGIIEKRYICQVNVFYLVVLWQWLGILYRSFLLVSRGEVIFGYNDLLSQHSKSSKSQIVIGKSDTRVFKY